MFRRCKQCRIEFTAKNKKNFFCSRVCANKYKTKKIPLTCKYCGAQFIVSPSAIKYGRKYCSSKCSLLDLPNRTFILNGKQYLSKRLKLICPTCNKEFSKTHANHKYCSVKCFTTSEKNNPNRIKKLKSSHLGRYKYAISAEKLKLLYLEQKLTINECADKLGLERGVIQRRLHLLAIPVRSKSETKIGILNPRYGKPGVMFGKRHTDSSKIKMSKFRKENPTSYWTNKKRPEMKNVKGFGDHKGKTYEEIMGEEKGFLRRKEMSRRMIENPEQARRGAMKMLQNLDSYKANTKIERIFKEELTRRGYQEGVDFLQQYNFLNKDRFSCDFGFPGSKLIVECDGDYWHANPEMYEGKKLSVIQERNLKFDKAKNAYIRKCGWRMIRFWGTDIIKNVKSCADRVIDIVNQNY